MTPLPDTSMVLDLLEPLVRCGAPTGQEHARAALIAQWLRDAGMGEPVMDEHANVWLWLGPTDQQAVFLDAHSDTVFPDLDIPLRKEGARWHAPGIFDNTVHIAQLLVWARWKHAQLAGRWPATVLSFTTGEEGQGNLSGMRQVCAQLDGRLRQGLILDLHMDRGLHQAVGSLRWEITFTTTGGHSWGDFGRCSAIHAMAQWIDRLAGLASWENQHTSYNVGVVQGGQGVNVIAAEASLLLDVRSVDPAQLATLHHRIEQDARDFAASQDDLRVTLKLIGDRPTGQTAPDAPIVQALHEAHRQLDIPLAFQVSSTNANWLMHLGIPAICTGLAHGQGVHTRAEWLDTHSIAPGLAKLDRLHDLLTADAPRQ